LFAAAFISLGIFVSSLFAGQIASLLVTAGSGFLLLMLGTDFVTQLVPVFVSGIFEKVSLMARFTSVARGVLDVSDIVYFVALMTVFLSLAFLRLINRKFGSNKTKFRSYQVGVALIVGIAVLISVLGNRLQVRIDLTRDQQFSLSPATKTVLGNLKDIATITLYSSPQVPAQYQPILRDTKDLLADYQSASRGNIVLKTVNPSKDSASAQDAQSHGITPIRFNTISGASDFQSQTGYLGILLAYAGKTEVIPFVQSTNDLEYQLTSLLTKLSTDNKKVVGFLSGNGEKSSSADFTYLTQELNKQFTVQDVTITKASPTIPATVSVLVIAGPTSALDQPTKDAVTTFAKTTGKGILLMADTNEVSVGQSSVQASANSASFADFVLADGVTINPDIVYDTQYHETVQLSSGGASYLIPYMYWIRAIPQSTTSPITLKIDYAYMPWTSSITVNNDVTKAAGYYPEPLLVTSKFAGASTATDNLNPDQQVSQSNLSQKTVAVALDVSPVGSPALAKMIVVGNSAMFADSSVQNAPENMTLALNMVSWLSQEASLGSIKIKGQSVNLLKFANDSQPLIIKYGVFAFVILVPAAYGAFRLLTRRNLRNKAYESKKS
jgi:ABC-2 type transport system permease protein